MRDSRISMTSFVAALWILVPLASGLGDRADAAADLGSSDSRSQTRQEISSTLDAWNSACSARDPKRVMAMIDDGPDVMVVGSDKGEVFKGREQIEGWLKGLLAVRGFSWEMDRVDIDANGATAWAFVEGRMVVADTSGTVLGKPPYRFTSVMVKKGETWKWRVFDGAIIGGE